MIAMSTCMTRAGRLIEKFGGKTVGHVVRRAEEAAKGMLLPSLIFEEFGLTYYGPIDGHNLGLLIETFKFLKAQNRPVILHALTQKGRGFQPALDKQKKFHGLGPYDPETGETKTCRRKVIRGSVCGNHGEAGRRMTTKWLRLRPPCRMARRWICSGRIIRSAISMSASRKSTR